MKTSFLCFAFLFCLAGIQSTFGQVAPAKKISVKPQSGAQETSLTAPTEDKLQKKTKTRGNCYIWFDNTTGYYLDVWVDNDYVCRLEPYAASRRIAINVSGTWTKWTAQTVSTKYWWTNNAYCNENRRFVVAL